MKAWWENLNNRERLMVSAVVLVVVFVLVDSLIIEGFRLKNQQLEEQVAQAKEDLAWMQQAVHRLPKGKMSQKQVVAGRIVSYVDQQVTRQGLKDKMQQMTPIQDHSVRLRLEDIRFDKLLAFLSQFDGAVIIQEVRILPAEQQGLVNVTLMVSNGRGIS